MEKKDYVKPEVVCQRDIKALTVVCEGQGNNTMQDKLVTDPNTSVCTAPMT